VFSGQYEQSWVPVVLALRELFPQAKINIIPYETYGDVLPNWLEAMTGIRDGWNLLEEDRPRESMNHLSVKIMNVAHLLIPPPKTAAVLEALSVYFFKKGKGGKYSPFSDSVKSSLRSIYANDLETIENLGGNVCLFKG